MSDVDDIVRELAARGPFVSDDDEGQWCSDCDVEAAPDKPIFFPTNHEPSCLWRRARTLYPTPGMGQCRDCRWWGPNDDEPGMGQCAQLHAYEWSEGSGLQLHPIAHIGEPLVTPELFGCNQFATRVMRGRDSTTRIE